MIATAAPRAASRGLAAVAAPASATARERALVDVVGAQPPAPAASSRRAIGPPMRPQPTNAERAGGAQAAGGQLGLSAVPMRLVLDQCARG